VLVNNAGIYEFGPLEAITPEHFHKQFNVNVLGLLLVTQAAVTRFNPAGGSIINIGSVVGKMAFPNGSVYSATKGVVDSITVSLSKELGAKKIRVNALNPGMVETEGAHAAGIIGSDFDKAIAAETPLGRIGQPQEIATAAAFLASADSGWLSGQTIYASGGYTR
jgi:3-oxoacyl-[acyl-carrier protein] reductase